MRISSEALAEYKAIFKKHYGQDLTDAEALESSTRLLNYFKTLINIAHDLRLRGEWPKEFEKETAKNPIQER